MQTAVSASPVAFRPTIMYLSFVLPNVLDAALTSLGVSVGAPESNPLMALALHCSGVAGLWMAKAFGIMVVIAAAECARVKCGRVPTMLFAGISGLSVAAAAHNVMFLARIFS